MQRPYPSFDAKPWHSAHESDAGPSAGRSSNRHDSDRYDSRYHRPSPPPTSNRSRTQQRSPALRKQSWPPQPFAEDEVVSLRRESNSQQLLNEIKRDGVPSRGSIDQEQIIVEVPELVNQHERRFVWTETGSRKEGIPTPPTSEDEKVRKVRTKPSKLSVRNDGNVPEMAKRTSSPYAYAKPAKLSDAHTSNRRSETLTPPSPGASGPRNARLTVDPTPSSPRRDSARYSPSARRGHDYFDAGYNDSKNTVGQEKRQPSSRNPINSSLSDAEISRSSPVEFVSFQADAPPIRKLNLDARRNTDTQNTLPTIGRMNLEKSRRPTPLIASNSLGEAHEASPFSAPTLDPRSADLHSRPRESSYSSSRAVSPASSIGQAYPPSRSPRLSSEVSQEGSVLVSGSASASNSRPASPSPRATVESPRLGKTDLDWSALLAANAARRSKPPSRLAPFAVDSPSKAPPEMPTNLAGSLPYPEDDKLMGSTIFMPEERDHAYRPERRSPLVTSFANESPKFQESPTATPTVASSASTKPTRPNFVRAFSASTTSSPVEARPSESRPRLAGVKRTESFASNSETKRELAALMKKGLPPCPRPDHVAGYDDWYTVIGATNIDFCPDCIDTLFERTVFRPHFRRSLPRSLNTKVRCAFGSPWTRLAWLLTLQQHRADLTLLKDLAEIEDTTEACPGNVGTVQSWYGLRDPDGRFVRDFHVCFADVRKIERLLPTLGGMLVRLPQRASYEKRTCAVRTDSTRFPTYLEALVSTHEQAHASRKGADPMMLIDLVERKTRLRECTGDHMLNGALWHFIPDVPSLTVCEDCFESIVEPEIKKGSSVAKKFNRTVQPVYGEGMGSSCQLYSKRTRKVFARAVEDSDLKYLARKSKERRETELYLQTKYKDILRRAKRLSQEGNAGDDDEKRLNRELEKISAEWKSKWE